MDNSLVVEGLIRGATAGILLIAAALFARGGRGLNVERLGAIFFVATAAYVIVSSPSFLAPLGVFLPVFVALATFNSVFFWWFATALFDDDFEWQPWRLAPFVLIAGITVFQGSWPDLANHVRADLLRQAVVVPMMIHALWLALAHRSDDLIEQRRAFRLAFAALAGVFGLVIAVGEVVLGESRPSQTIMMLHALGLFALTFGLTVWVVSPVRIFSVGAREQAYKISAHSSADRAELARLSQLMDGGVYRQEGLTIGALAKQVAIPEHRLRRLINNELGFRNFTAYLNERRIADSKSILADPDQARRQITQIALDLGYGSVGPFNRAFKAATGQTPTAYRQECLSKAAT
ncbi:MAG: AraC family transcriptional regulator [Alphaproteobacteria bacterium]|nr:AraC family transcriptional regulator [Alphaproteobacteria bacterium]